MSEHVITNIAIKLIIQSKLLQCSYAQFKSLIENIIGE